MRAVSVVSEILVLKGKFKIHFVSNETKNLNTHVIIVLGDALLVRLCEDEVIEIDVFSREEVDEVETVLVLVLVLVLEDVEVVVRMEVVEEMDDVDESEVEVEVKLVSVVEEEVDDVLLDVDDVESDVLVLVFESDVGSKVGVVIGKLSLTV